MEWPFADKELPEKSFMEELARSAQSCVPQTSVCWSGSTKLEQSITKTLPDKNKDTGIHLTSC